MLEGATSPFVQGAKYPRPRPTTKQKQVRLSAEQQQELVERYRAGVLQRELAIAYGIERRTVSIIIKRHGATQRRGLTAEQIDQAVVAYADGDSLATIADRLGVTAHTVRSRLLERDVAMRDTHGRPRP